MSSNKDVETQNTASASREIHTKNKTNFKNEYQKDVKQLWKECRKSILKGIVASVAAISVCTAVNQLEWKLGYEVYVDGENIGYVTDKAVVYDAIEDARANVKTYLGEDVPYDKTPVFVRRIVSKNNLVSKGALTDNMLDNVDALTKAYAVYIDGEVAFGVSDVDAAERIFSQYKASVVGEITDDMAVEFCENIEIKNEYMHNSLIKSEESALAVIEGSDKDSENGAPLLSVRCVQTVLLTEPVPFEVQKIDDDSIYEGRTVVAQEGAEGEQKVLATVTTVNGVETDKKVLSTEKTTEPIARIERIGTKERPATTGSGTFTNPSGGILSSRYGQRWDRSHNGIDIAGQHNSDIKAADGGLVTYADWMDGYGNYIIIDHENGYQTAYGHCASLDVSKGDRVAKGEVIAKMGSTGRSTGTHLHFEVKKDGVFVNPLEYVGY